MKIDQSSKPTVAISPAKAENLAQLRHRVLQAFANHPCKVYLFGSWATGTAYLSSDVDIGVLPDTRLPSGLLSQLRADLDESSSLLTVDLIDLSETEKRFRRRVVKEGILWTDSSNASPSPN